jgi:hypothetical protein
VVEGAFVNHVYCERIPLKGMYVVNGEGEVSVVSDSGDLLEDGRSVGMEEIRIDGTIALN